MFCWLVKQNPQLISTIFFSLFLPLSLYLKVIVWFSHNFYNAHNSDREPLKDFTRCHLGSKYADASSDIIHFFIIQSSIIFYFEALKKQVSVVNYVILNFSTHRICLYVYMFDFCVYVFVCVCMCLFVCVYVCVCMCLFVCVYVFVCMYVCMCLFVCVYVFVCMYVCMCLYVCMCVCIYTNIVLHIILCFLSTHLY